MGDVGKLRTVLVTAFFVLLSLTFLGRWYNSGEKNTYKPIGHAAHECSLSVDRQFVTLQSKYLDFFISTIMNLQYNYFDGYIDGNTVPPNAVALSMAGKRRLDNFALAVSTVVVERIEGDIIETGAWKGGASFVAAKVLEMLAEHDSYMGRQETRRIYICDSFRGIPDPPSDRIYNTEDHNANFPVFSELLSAVKVKVDATRFGLNVDNIVVVEGYFNVTLPRLVTTTAPRLKLAVLRLDGDTYFSTMDALTVLYPRLQPGGIVIVDDFIDWAGCREAVDDYRTRHHIRDPIVLVPHKAGEILRGAYWRKGSSLPGHDNSVSSSGSDKESSVLSPSLSPHSIKTIDTSQQPTISGSSVYTHLCLGDKTRFTLTPLLYPNTAYMPLQLVSVPVTGPKGLIFDAKVFEGRTDLLVCV